MCNPLFNEDVQVCFMCNSRKCELVQCVIPFLNENKKCRFVVVGCSDLFLIFSACCSQFAARIRFLSSMYLILFSGVSRTVINEALNRLNKRSDQKKTSVASDDSTAKTKGRVHRPQFAVHSSLTTVRSSQITEKTEL